MGKTSQEVLAAKLAAAQKQVELGGTYRHYRSEDMVFTVIALALDEETEGVRVIYRAHYGEKLVWARDLEDWLAMVETSDGKVPRFQRIS